MSDIKNKKINLGIILIIIGSIWILSNLNIIDIDFQTIINHIIRGVVDLWPLILVVVGIGIIFKNDLLNTALWILFLVTVVVYSLFFKDNILDKDYKEAFIDEVYTSEMKEGINRGSLILDVGATSFNIDAIEDDFIKIEQDGAFKYKFSNKQDIDTIYMSNKKDTFINGKSRKFDLGINKDIPWQFKMNIGAVSGNLNLKDIMVRHIILDMGAGDIEITLGKKNNFTSVNIDAGASRIVINIPKDVGVKIDMDGALNSTNLDGLGLIKTSKGKYISEKYDDATNKYEIEVDMGVGSFEINYY